ncbi:MAG: TROVE domain-containing protein [Desulfobulbus sp.]|nr:TROVE domain-containing protein [Desulfobulbus sp.]
MKFNLSSGKPRTHEGAVAPALAPAVQLARSVMACMLWEDTFYEDGVSIAERIKELTPLCAAEQVAELAVKAREEGKLRHAPLLLLRELARHPARPKIAGTLARIIQRADEPAEFLALYWSEGKQPLSRQVKLGLGKAMQKFDAYQLAKYDRPGAVRLRDVLFMVHAKPKNEEQAASWKELVAGTLSPPDTWEVALSNGADKRETFTRLLREKKLGYLALLRNLRNMMESGVAENLITDALLQGAERGQALPFRFIAAARAVPSLEPILDEAMQQATKNLERLPGKTAVIVDVSGSMEVRLAKKSDLTRMDAAAALAVLLVAVAEQSRVFTFSDKLVEVPSRQGMALVDAIHFSQAHGITLLGEALAALPGSYDRVVVVTDEQSADAIPTPSGKGYMINVASYKNGIGYGQWTHVDGFSESVAQYIQAQCCLNE